MDKAIWQAYIIVVKYDNLIVEKICSMGYDELKNWISKNDIEICRQEKIDERIRQLKIHRADFAERKNSINDQTILNWIDRQIMLVDKEIEIYEKANGTT